MKLSLYVKTSLIAWVILFILGKIFFNYPSIIIALFTLILSLWVGFAVDLLFGEDDSSDGGNGDTGWEGACGNF